MKVVHIDSEKSFRGGQRQVLYLVNGLKSLGVESIIVTPPRSALYSACSRFTVEPVSMKGEWNLIAAVKICRIINDHRPDIIHCHSAHALTYGLFGKRFAHHKPAVIAARRVDFHIRNRRKYLAADKIVTVSEAIKQVLISDGLPPDKIEVVHSGIDPDRVRGLDGMYLFDELGLSPDDIVIGNVAALTPQKDHLTLLKAVPGVVAGHKNAKFVIVGEGKLRGNLEIFSKRTGIGDRVIFTGFREDVLNLMSIFNIFVITSRWEGLGTSILDAMAMGIPVVAADVGGIPEIIENEGNGFLVPVGDHAAFSERISRLIEDEALRAEFSVKGKETANRFRVGKTVLATFGVYKKLLDSGKVGGSQ